MTVAVMQHFFLWCFIINSGLLLLWFLVYAIAADWIYQIHHKWFAISKETFSAIHYGGMATYKMAIIMFNLVPYLALLFAGK